MTLSYSVPFAVAIITGISFVAAFERIPTAYKKLLQYLQANSFKEKPQEDILSCFEYVYEKDGVTCMDVYMQAASVTKTEAFTNFS